MQRDGLLLLGGLLAASTHHEGVMEARELRQGELGAGATPGD